MNANTTSKNTAVISTSEIQVVKTAETASVTKMESILTELILDSPVSSNHKVTFDFSPKVKILDPIEKTAVDKKIKRVLNFEVRDKTIILPKSMMKVAKKRAKKYTVIIPSANTITLKYRLKEDLETDLKILGLKPKTYVENTLIVYNFSYKETEKTVFEFFSQFAKPEKVILEKNSKGFCTGKGTITFSTSFNPIHESRLYDLRLNGRLLRIERIKKQIVNTSRLCISHMKKALKISDLRAILKANGFVPKNIKIDLRDGRNKGYGFVEFNSPQEAEGFISDFDSLKPKLGEDSLVEFSQEKSLNTKNNKR